MARADADILHQYEPIELEHILSHIQERAKQGHYFLSMDFPIAEQDIVHDLIRLGYKILQNAEYNFIVIGWD